MPTVSRGLPRQPHLDIPKRQARELLAAWRAARPDALDRIRGRHPKFKDAPDATIAGATFKLADAQLVIAREYTYATWSELKRRIESNPATQALESALYRGEREEVGRLLRAHPHLLHLPVRGGNWGPPMSFAANLGHLAIIQDAAALGARDFQHAFDRAVLQGRIDCARWLHAHGAALVPGIVMGACETLNPAGLRFLAEVGAPFTDARGDRLAPLALVLETYGRGAARKHEVLELFRAQGYVFPDTPIMAFHRGRIDLLERHLARDPGLLARRFAYRDIYPPELGCAGDGRSGLHGTPIGGTTLLHLAIDFEEQGIFDWLVAHGADVNVRADQDADGFGGHTPLFHCTVSHSFVGGGEHGVVMARTLLARGADPRHRASLRKFLDWCDEPRWHIAREVTAAEWAQGFPEAHWINRQVLALIA